MVGVEQVVCVSQLNATVYSLDLVARVDVFQDLWGAEEHGLVSFLTLGVSVPYLNLESLPGPSPGRDRRVAETQQFVLLQPALSWFLLDLFVRNHHLRCVQCRNLLVDLFSNPHVLRNLFAFYGRL